MREWNFFSVNCFVGRGRGERIEIVSSLRFLDTDGRLRFLSLGFFVFVTCKSPLTEDSNIRNAACPTADVATETSSSAEETLETSDTSSESSSLSCARDTMVRNASFRGGRFATVVAIDRGTLGRLDCPLVGIEDRSACSAALPCPVSRLVILVSAIEAFSVNAALVEAATEVRQTVFTDASNLRNASVPLWLGIESPATDTTSSLHKAGSGSGYFGVDSNSPDWSSVSNHFRIPSAVWVRRPVGRVT